MDTNDLKKMALLGICSGMMLAAGGADSLYAAEMPANADDVKAEKNGCKGENGCGGPGGCAGNGCEGEPPADEEQPPADEEQPAEE